jgi:hypothetical protein
MRTVPFALASLLALAGVAHADGKFHAVPKSKLSLRVVQYDGEVNGELTVEIKNRGGRAERFTAQGLYFVPDGDPDQAPQRLGAVGPILAEDTREDAISIPAGGKVTVKLDVFCVDDHRDAPTSETPFTIARHRMPKQLATEIDRNGRAAAKNAGGVDKDHASVQDAVWETRDEKWVKLDGEGAQEKAKSSPHHHHPEEQHPDYGPEPHDPSYDPDDPLKLDK